MISKHTNTCNQVLQQVHGLKFFSKLNMNHYFIYMSLIYIDLISVQNQSPVSEYNRCAHLLAYGDYPRHEEADAPTCTPVYHN